jgi:signal transduction histidine kinase
VGTLIVFQGPERKYGVYLAFFTLLVLAFLMSFDLHYSKEKPTEMQEGVSLELVLNIVGAALGTFLEVSFILSLSNKLDEKLHKANKELDNFVYSVSHDLRSPLASVKGLLALAKDSKTETEELEDYLALAEKKLDNLDDIIREILAYSRNSRTALVKEQVDIPSMVASIYSELQFLPESNFEFRWGPLEAKDVMADKSRLHTVLRNMIGNAVKYRNKNTSAPFVEVSINKISTTVQITIRDNGEGIEPEAQTKIFEMFYRNSNAAEGTGLGLYICRDMMERMGGNISLKSKRGKGSAFVVELPG